VGRAGRGWPVRPLGLRTGQPPWYQRATASGTGRLRAGGTEQDVAFAPADAYVQDEIDAAYHAKYDRYGPRIVGSVTGPASHAVTVRLLPQSGE